MPAKVYSDDVRASALAALAMGMSIRAVAREHGVARHTVTYWRDTAGQLIEPEKRADLGELIAHYLRAGLETLEAQAVLARDEAWLRQYSPSELAILHGVLADKLVRVLASLEPGDQPTTVDAAAPPAPTEW